MTDVTHDDHDALPVTERTRLRRMTENARPSRAELSAVLAAGFVCHLGVVVNGTPMVVPTVYGATADVLYVHGSSASRSLVAAPGATICVTVTHLDGIVLARSVFEHSINYRCAMVYGVPRVVSDQQEKLAGLKVVSEQCAPGQWDYVRQPSRKELAATTLLALELTQASVKVRSGPPDDAESNDALLGLWAGVIPLSLTRGAPVADPALPADVTVPAHLLSLATLEQR